MNRAETAQTDSQDSARKSPRIARKATDSARKFVLFDGRKYPLVRDHGGLWRLRSRSKSHPVDIGLGTTEFAAARTIARRMLEERPTKTRRGAKTLEDLARFYETEAPRRCNDTTAATNVGRFRSLIRTAWGKELSAVKDSELSASLWLDFLKAKQGGKLDLASRRPENEAINAAMRHASGLFAERLLPHYKAAGFEIAADVATIPWLPIVARAPKPADDAAIMQAWEEMADDELNRPLWIAVGLARFAGLRRSEIENARREWLTDWKGRTYIELRDRPEEHYYTKTGKPYRALILSDQLAERLCAVPSGEHLVQPEARSRHNWFATAPQEWAAQFSSARLPLHRLRGLYADDIKRLTEDAVAAHLAGVKAASEALGHTSTKTTENHYLSRDAAG